MREDNSGLSTIRRKRRKHPSLLRTSSGIEEIIPGLSTWTAEDLLEAGAWDEELEQLTGASKADDGTAAEPRAD